MCDAYFPRPQTNTLILPFNRSQRPLHGWPVFEFVGCDKGQRRHTMSVIWCACALLVTPYKLRMVNNRPTMAATRSAFHSAPVAVYDWRLIAVPKLHDFLGMSVTRAIECFFVSIQPVS